MVDAANCRDFVDADGSVCDGAKHLDSLWAAGAGGCAGVFVAAVLVEQNEAMVGIGAVWRGVGWRPGDASSDGWVCAVGSVLLLGVVLSQRSGGAGVGNGGIGLTAVAVAAGLQLVAPAESAEYQRVALTRTYWFLSQWHWYELIGLVAPLMILSVVALGRRRDGRCGAGWPGTDGDGGRVSAM